MKRAEFIQLYADCLVEASRKWPEEYEYARWHEKPTDQLTTFAVRAVGLIPTNGITMTGSRTAFNLLARRLGVSHSVKAIQAALAACEDA